MGSGRGRSLGIAVCQLREKIRGAEVIRGEEKSEDAWGENSEDILGEAQVSLHFNR
jgi:hypothetical protein